MSPTPSVEEPSVAPAPRPGGAATEPAGSFGPVLAGLMFGAGLIHLVMAPVHAQEGFADALGFAAVGWVQVGIAVLALLGVARRATLVGSVVVNFAVTALWVWSRTAGLPFGAHAGTPEEVGLVDGLAAGLQVAAILVALVMLVAPRELSIGRVMPAVVAVAVLGLVTAVVVAPETAEHGESGHAHGAGDTAEHTAEMAVIDDTRCDLAFNPVGYWAEARDLGVDTYAGGAMEPHQTAEDLAEVERFRSTPGTPDLDRLVSATFMANQGEAAAGALVAQLGGVDDATYEQWKLHLRSLASTGGGHAHGAEESSTAAPDDNGGHGGHVGPTPWVAMTEQDDCDTLAEELRRARDVALRHPTAADAMAAGYSRTTTYVPGIAAHYMKFAHVDGRFVIEEPEMLLYDGDGPDAAVVGLSYYILHPGDNEPTQGFTGPNDHFHRHIGLCIKGGLVIGDSTTTEEECAARGGSKNGGGSGWMNHVWVVPGCESPWGVFSGASPLLELGLSQQSGKDGGGCAGSGVVDRYDLSPGDATSVPGVEELASGSSGG